MVSADRLLVALIVCAALVYLATRLRAKKGHDCCGNKVSGKRRV